MAERENTDLGMRGGVLADDMGLGKTLSTLALIMTNFHDKRPLARPQHGFNRTYDKGVVRYMPRTPADKKNAAAMGRKDSNVGKSLGAGSTNFSLSNIFGNMKDGRQKDTKQKSKSAKFRNMVAYSKDVATGAPAKTIEEELAGLDESLLSDEESEDEFDSMLGSGSLKDKLGVDVEKFKKEKGALENGGGGDGANGASGSGRNGHFNDGLSDDDEYQAMSDKERNERMKPKMNVDGGVDLSSDDSDFEPEPSKRAKTTAATRKRKISSSDEGEEQDCGEDSFELPDIDDDAFEEKTPEVQAAKEKKPKIERQQSKSKMEDMLTEEQLKAIIMPARQPAVCGRRRRATLIVTPASLISHWLEQIKTHVDRRVELKIFVHHGQSKAHIATELERQDLVFTTYGTMQAELNDGASVASPLLSAKWLRVCLDEGHFIKNHNAKTAKAANALNTERKWIISGTPIQNNLKELWSLLFWLKLQPFSDSRQLFKRQIETPIKQGHPNGFEVSATQLALFITFVRGFVISVVISVIVGGWGGDGDGDG